MVRADELLAAAGRRAREVLHHLHRQQHEQWPVGQVGPLFVDSGGQQQHAAVAERAFDQGRVLVGVVETQQDAGGRRPGRWSGRRPLLAPASSRRSRRAGSRNVPGRSHAADGGRLGREEPPGEHAAEQGSLRLGEFSHQRVGGVDVAEAIAGLIVGRRHHFAQLRGHEALAVAVEDAVVDFRVHLVAQEYGHAAARGRKGFQVARPLPSVRR